MCLAFPGDDARPETLPLDPSREPDLDPIRPKQLHALLPNIRSFLIVRCIKSDQRLVLLVAGFTTLPDLVFVTGTDRVLKFIGVPGARSQV